MESNAKTELRTVHTDQQAEEPQPRPQGRLGSVVRELRQRKVCRAAITYVLILWLNLQIGDVLFPMMGLPDWTLQLIMLIGIMGFPVVLLLAWLFQVTPDGVVLDLAPARPERTVDRYLERTVSLLLLLLSLALTLLLGLQFLDTSAQAAEPGSMLPACGSP